jgi:hypothetical protein
VTFVLANTFGYVYTSKAKFFQIDSEHFTILPIITILTDALHEDYSSQEVEKRTNKLAVRNLQKKCNRETVLAPILPNFTDIVLQIFVTYAVYIPVTFCKYFLPSFFTSSLSQFF